MDIVIYDRQYSPFVFYHNGVIYVPAKSVYAVFEVKPKMNKENLEYAAGKIESVRKLKRTSAAILHAGGKIQTPKKPFKIIGGILTTKSKWNPPLGENFEKIVLSFEEEKAKDIGCSLSGGSFLVDKESEEDQLKKIKEDEVLIFFFLHLSMELQNKGTVPAMDILEYAKALESI